MNSNRTKAMPLLIVGIIALIAFIFEAVSVAKSSNWVAKFDLSWIARVRDGHISSGTTKITEFMSHLGSAEYLIVATIIVVIILFILRKFTVGLWFGGTFLFCGVVCNYLLKQFMERNRPNSSNWLVPENGFSYPSGHATATTVFYGLAALFLIFTVKQIWAKIVIGALALLMIVYIMYSRVYLGVHYPTDVLGGFLFGTASVAISTGVYFLVRKPLHGLLTKWRLKDLSKTE
ncbi:acid phosphatase/vanadium-dependent haloperoxidase family protein [Listeria floridensis FSL S10-1187]|uniref:Acid phosphatase/vanadium-dependent haloperoxidase family protein n=1 Tax=Listeria floridensis FSL S10-1187 TaxID=1265817 RepID=A0ABP3B043_9LIST|nr:phosphatase PAP2 family protein [Listeria floridensis]EUJ32095.1 acid phosphatase/vanadium-dependent haloperoxidase family protein [Listeria floridensis FSL S10-1187]